MSFIELAMWVFWACLVAQFILVVATAYRRWVGMPMMAFTFLMTITSFTLAYALLVFNYVELSVRTFGLSYVGVCAFLVGLVSYNIPIKYLISSLKDQP